MSSTVTSETAVCNSSLALIGVDPISAMSEDSKEARLCREFYYKTRDLLLRNFSWNFSIYRATLAPLDATPEFKWAYQYQLPSDCLRVLRVNDSEDPQFAIESDKLLLNYEVANVAYIKKVTDVSKFDPAFVEALIDRIASKLAYPLVQSRTLSRELYDLADREIREARAQDAMESSQTYAGEDFFSNSRNIGLYD